MDGPAGEDLLFRWADQGFMTRENILTRIDKEISDSKILSNDEDKQLKSFFMKQAIPSGYAETLCLNETRFIEGLKGVEQSGNPPFLDVLPILFRSIVYLSSYPFPSKPSYITFEGLRRAVVLLLPDPEREDRGRADVLIGAHNSGRARTKWDRRRLLFQSFAKNQAGNDLLFDEPQWRENAARRAADYPDPCEDFTLSNRDEDGDELFHDYVDFMEATQLIPVIGPRARIARRPFLSLARVQHAKNRTPRLKDLVISYDDLHNLIRTMLCLHLDSSGQYFRGHPEELLTSSNCVAAAFLHGQPNVDWEMFASALGRTTPWLFKPLFFIASHSICATPAEHKEILPPRLGTVLNVPQLAQLSLLLHDDFDFESFKLVYSNTMRDQSDGLPELAQHLSSDKAHEYPGLLLFSAIMGEESQSYVFGFWSEHPAKDQAAIQPSGNPEYQVCSLFQLSPVHDVFPGQPGKPAWQVRDGEVRFGDQECGVSIQFRAGLHQAFLAHHFAGMERENGSASFAATDWRGDWELELHINCIEYWQYIVDE